MPWPWRSSLLHPLICQVHLQASTRRYPSQTAHRSSAVLKGGGIFAGTLREYFQWKLEEYSAAAKGKLAATKASGSQVNNYLFQLFNCPPKKDMCRLQ